MIFFGSKDIEQEINYLLHSQPGIGLVASTDSANALPSLLERYAPQLLLLEQANENTKTMSLVRRIRAQYPQIRLLILAHEVNIAQIRECISIGVSAYLLVGSSLEGLAISIRLVNSGKLTLSSEITQALLASK
jgi:DNA-binding NarL/FixJ family response regulator